MRKLYNLLMVGLLAATGLSASAATPKPNKLAPPTGRETIVEDQPEGKLTLLSRTCRGMQEFMGTVENVIEEGSIVKMVEQKDGTVWLGNIISRFPLPGWVKAEKEDDLLVIRGPQLVYEEYDYVLDNGSYLKYYISPVEIQYYTNDDGIEMMTYVPKADGIFTFKIDGDRIVEFNENPNDKKDIGSLILGLVNYNKIYNYFFTGYGDNYIVMDVPKEKPAVVPASAEIHEKWAMQYDYLDFATYKYMKSAKFVDVAIDGNDYYIKGIYPAISDAWVKGTLQGNSIVFPNFQMIGPNLEYNYFVYLCGGQLLDSDMYEGVKEGVIDPDGFALTLEKDGTLTAETNIIFATYPDTNPDDANFLDYFEAVEIHPQDPNSFSAPAPPDDMFIGGIDGDIALEFVIAAMDVDGNILNEDDYYFSIYVNDEIFTFTPDLYPDLKGLGIDGPTTELPYNIGNDWGFFQDLNWHTVYIFGIPTEDIKTIGLQCIYYPEGKDVNPDNFIEGKKLYAEVNSNSVDSIEAGDAVRIEYFDMQGRKVMTPSNGIYIKTVTYSDGSVKTSKVALKK